MRILIAHNAYQHHGGEDTVVGAEAELLRAHGHVVEHYIRHNDEIPDLGAWRAGRDALWSPRTFFEISERIEAFRPTLIHAHNTFPLISPSLCWAAARAGIPVVQTLHNFRLLCPQAMFLRDGRVCEDCLGKLPWRGVVHRCYRRSFSQSGVLAAMLVLHRALGSYQHKVNRYIALNDFCRQIFVRGGLPAERVRVKPNFVDLPPPGLTARQGCLFVGRLSAEKGVRTLAETAALAPEVALTVVGTGPEERLLRGLDNVHLLGFQEPPKVREAMTVAICLTMPSVWYENFPRTLVESFACGLPVVASRLGAMADLIRDGKTGLLFETGNAADLAAKLRWAQGHPDEMRRMGEAAREEYEAKYAPQENYSILMEIYREAIAEVVGHAG